MLLNNTVPISSNIHNLLNVQYLCRGAPMGSKTGAPISARQQHWPPHSAAFDDRSAEPTLAGRCRNGAMLSRQWPPVPSQSTAPSDSRSLLEDGESRNGGKCEVWVFREICENVMSSTRVFPILLRGYPVLDPESSAAPLNSRHQTEALSWMRWKIMESQDKRMGELLSEPWCANKISLWGALHNPS